MQASSSHSDTQLIAALQRLAAVAAVITALLATVVLAGWAFNADPLESLVPGQVSMKPLTALGLLLGAAALWLVRQRTGGWQRRLGLILAGAMAAIGGLILLEYLLGINLGIDQVLFRQALLAEDVLPIGRPSPVTALCFLLLGLALLWLDARPAFAWLAPTGALVALALSGLALLGYIYQVSTLYQFASYTPIALHTAVAIVLLALGLLAARPTGPIVGVLTTQMAGSVIGRRLLLAVLVVPFGLAWLWLYGQRLGLYDIGFGVTLLVTGNVVVFAALVYASARLLNHAEAEREAVHGTLRLTEENQRLMLDSIKDHAIFMLDTQGRVATWNTAAERIKGYTAAEIIGQPVSVFYPPEEAGAGKARQTLEVAAAKGPVEEEGYRVRKDGSRFWAIADTAALRDERGVLRGYSKVTRDITERKEAETALREREGRLRVLADATPNGLIIVADSSEITWANQRAEVLFGFGQGQLIGRSIDELVPRRYQSVHSAHRAGFAADRRVRLMGAGRDLFGQRQDGIEFPVEIGLSPVETSQGKVTLASIIDITERKRVETALRLSEERFAKAFRASPAALTVTNLATGLFVDVNDQFLLLLGYERDELIGHTSSELNMFPEPADRAEPVGRLRAEGAVRNVEMDLLTKTGERRSVLFSTETIELGGEAHALAILIDNTERTQAERALVQLNAELEQRVQARTAELAANEAKFRTLFNVLPVGISILDDQRAVVESNASLARIMKMSSAGLAADPYANRKFIHPDGTPMPPKDFPSARAVVEQRPVLNVEVGIVTETGDTIWADVSAAPLPVAGLSAVTVTVDQTDRKRIEAGLRQSEERFATAFRSSPTALTISRVADNSITDVNEVFQSLFGYSREEIVGHKTPGLYLNPNERAEIGRLFREQGSVHDYEITLQTKAGEPRTVLMSVDPMELDGQVHLLSTMLDITERKRVEAALRQSEKRFATAFRSSPTALTITRLADNSVIDVNDAFQSLLGYSREEVVGHITPALYSNPDERAEIVRRFRQQGSIHDLEITLQTKSGELRSVLMSVDPLELDGQAHHLSTMLDITERKRIEAALAHERDQLQALLDNIPDTIYFKDRASRFTRVNLAQARMLGIAAPELAVGKTDADFQPSELSAEFYAEEQRLLESGQPVVDRREYNPTATGGPRWLSATKVPLKDATGQVVGLVGMSRDITARMQAEEDLQRVNQQLADRVNELSLLNQFEEQLQSCQSIEETYPLTTQFMRQLAPDETGALSIVNADRTQVCTAGSWGTPAPEPQVFALDDCWALRRGQVYVLDDEHPGPRCRHWNDAAPGASMCMPLMARDQALGLLHLRVTNATRARVFDESAKQLAHVVADGVALTWANLTLRETLRQQAIRDPLTDLYNRRFMEESLLRELHRAARVHQSVSLIMMDIDHFKQVNDRLGHAIGDEVLRELGRLLQDTSRGSDIPCRYGGEEFLLIMPEASVEIAGQRAEQIRERFRQMKFGVAGDALGPVTLSLGVAAFPQNGEVMEAVLRAVDAALYQAKSEGRDRTSVAK